VRVDGVLVAIAAQLPAAPQRIVVLRALGLGDLLTAVPALRALLRHYRDAEITLAIPEPYRELALHTDAVDTIAPTKGLGDFSGGYHSADLAVNLHGSGPQSIDHLLATYPEALLTYRHAGFPDIIGPPWAPDIHEIERWCGLLRWAGIESDADDYRLAPPPKYHAERGTVVLHPGAASGARRWPVQRFAAVAAALTAAGHEVLITGSTGEKALALKLAALADLPSTSVLAGQSNLMELLAVISSSRLVICGDTGVGHLATAVGTPSVLLFGPTPPSHWGPRDGERHRVLWCGMRGDPHADQPDPGLLRLTIAQVTAMAHQLLRRYPSNRQPAGPAIR